MIKSIHIKNVFKHKNTYVEFKEGVNYLTGANESGKTVILEMIAYGLFGTPVLRSEASDYKNTEVTLTFSINNITYIIERSKKTNLYKETLVGKSTKKEVIATSITAVNKQVVELLGYDSTVFYKTNFSTQLDGHSHATAKKSERIALINKINGIEDATKFEKYLEQQRKSIKAEMKGLSATINMNNIEWVANPAIEYLTQADLNSYKDNIDFKLDKVNSLQQQLSALDMIPTINEEDQKLFNTLSTTSYKLTEQGLEFIGIQSYYNYLTPLYEEYMTIQEVKDKYKDYIKANSVFDNNGRLVTPELLLDLLDKQEKNNNYTRKQALLNQGNVCCPSCSTSFPLSIDELNLIKDGDVFYTIPSSNIISSYKRFIEYHYDNVLKYKKELENINESYFNVDEYRIVKSKYQVYVQLNNKLEQHNTLKTSYEIKYNTSLNTNTKLTLLNNIQALLSEIDKYKTKYEVLDQYLREKELYTSSINLKEQIQNKIQICENQVTAYTLILEKSKELRLSIQNSCIPSLNKKSSNVINKMTGAQHYSLDISDTFELLLDGNLLAKYSGSTQVISSVAFRIALMDLFYKRTFPVFIGDEVDSFTDEDRASFVRNAFNVIAKEGFQLILISHFKEEDLDGNIIKIENCKNSNK